MNEVGTLSDTISIINAKITCGTPDENGCYNLDNLTIKLDGEILDPSAYTLSTNEYVSDGYVKTRVTIIGKGNYTGTASATFNTAKSYIDINSINIYIEKDTIEYTGSEITPNIITELIEDVDYTVEYINNIEIGQATINITGSGNYTGTMSIYFNIIPKNIGKATIDIKIKNGVYDLDTLIVILDNNRLEKDTDYTFITREEEIDNYKKLRVIIYGIGHYDGILQKLFDLNKIYIDINEKDIYINSSFPFVFNGSEIKPPLSTDGLIENIDFLVNYENNINASSSAKITINGIGDYDGNKEILFTIEPKSINNAKIISDNIDQDGNHNIDTLIVEESGVLLIRDVDYKLEIEEKIQNNNDIISYIKIIAINNYTGTRSVSYKTGEHNGSIYTGDFMIGQAVELKNVKVYPRWGSSKTDIVKTGTYYIWDLAIKNNRIRITKIQDKVGILGQITGWVDIEDLLKDPDDIHLGDQVLVSGDINIYADGSGNSIHKKNTLMYVTDLLNPDQFTHYIGLSSARNRTKIGWASKDIVTKVEE